MYLHGDTMYISGTHSARDVKTDLFVPYGLTNTQRYQEALEFYLFHKPKTIVGHSLGSAIAKRISDDHMEGVLEHQHVRMYGAPMFLNTKLRRHEKSFRHTFDPVSFLDPTATSSSASGINPHAFTGFTRP